MTTNHADFAAYSTLASADPVLGGLVRRLGEPDPFEFPDEGRTVDNAFAGMVLHILAQQISVKVAIILYDRLAHTTRGDLAPEHLLQLSADEIRAVGTSHAKAAYLHDLSERVCSGNLDFTRLSGMPDEEAIAALTQVKGVGPWSAEMFLIHQLRRPDVLPAGDLGIRSAFQKAFILGDPPTIAEARELGARWTPHRTYAAALLWRSLKAL